MPAKRALIGVLAAFMGMSACNLPTDQVSRADQAGTITAQALTIQARADTAAAPTEAPTATDETGTLTSVPVPTTYVPAATNPPQPTKTRKPTKTPEPVLAAIPASPIAPEINLIETWSCTPTTFKEGQGWIAELKIYWTDNSSDEEYFLLYSSTALHPEKQLVTAPPANTTTITLHRSYFQSSIAAEPSDTFYIAAYNASGTSWSPHTYPPVSRCTQAF